MNDTPNLEARGPESVTLSRAQRDALHRRATWLVSMSMATDFESLRDQRHQVAEWLRLFDQIGWEFDGTADTYSLSIDLDHWRRELRRVRVEILETLEHDAESLAKARDGDPDHLFVGASLTETEAKHRKENDFNLDELRDIDRVLEAIR